MTTTAATEGAHLTGETWTILSVDSRVLSHRGLPHKMPKTVTTNYVAPWHSPGMTYVISATTSLTSHLSPIPSVTAATLYLFGHVRSRRSSL